MRAFTFFKQWVCRLGSEKLMQQSVRTVTLKKEFRRFLVWYADPTLSPVRNQAKNLDIDKIAEADLTQTGKDPEITQQCYDLF